MEKIFKTFLKQELTAFMSAHSGWRPCKAPKGDYYITGKGPLWKRVGAQGRAVFLMCFIHEKRSEVELFLGWNAVDEFPPIGDFMENQVRHDLQGAIPERADAAVKLMLGSADGWLPAYELGLPQFFGLAVEVPPMARLESVFDDPKNAKEVDVALIQGSPYANWREATLYHYWGMVDHFDPLTLDDARVAVGGTRDALVEVLTQHYLPIADRYLAPAD